ncbi:hypothetical protein JJD61_07360 [Pseudomonas carnis]|uniref:hypothetical protein n=1 Tax=Pseudomonas carnis TaxID=2487355 RepID=UPI0019097131|nr:hypothetical protein [Pseudomonas carnis]MBK3470499.1 hypothetical protein [Pseudomonas carnis]
MPTHHDETLPQRYEREHQAYLKLCGSMTAEQVADLQLQLNNSMAREQALQALLTAADERADVLEGLLRSLPEDLKELSGCENTAGVYACIDYIEQLVVSLKPAEGGGDD